MSLGYPGDHSSHNLGPLTFSFGKLVSFMKQTFSTSVYINGASGSPMLSLKTERVVGVVSNGAGAEDQPGNGFLTS